MSNISASEIAPLSVFELSRFLAAGEMTAVEITEALINRIEEKNETYRAFFTTSFELALKLAARSDARRVKSAPLSPIDGIPVALKDAYDTKGSCVIACLLKIALYGKN